MLISTSISGSVRPSVGPSVGPSVRRSVGPSVRYAFSISAVSTCLLAPRGQYWLLFSFSFLDSASVVMVFASTRQKFVQGIGTESSLFLIFFLILCYNIIL